MRLPSHDFSFAKCAILGSFWRPIGANLRAKDAYFALFKKAMSLVFNHFLSSFPLFLYFLAILQVPPVGQYRTLPHFPVPRPRRNVCSVKKLEFGI